MRLDATTNEEIAKALAKALDAWQSADIVLRDARAAYDDDIRYVVATYGPHLERAATAPYGYSQRFGTIFCTDMTLPATVRSVPVPPEIKTTLKDGHAAVQAAEKAYNAARNDWNDTVTSSVEALGGDLQRGGIAVLWSYNRTTQELIADDPKDKPEIPPAVPPSAAAPARKK